ncbi:MAG TPA: hypothetical protein EYP14_04515, partial [Planctomycetaceae bacterium]|nr:hypothetical protein [Planctomycetaceae bacterium]
MVREGRSPAGTYIRIASVGIWSALFPASVAYVWWAVRPSLFYEVFGIYLPYPAFFLDFEFVRRSLAEPAGMTESVGALLSHCFRFSWAGALIICGLAWLIGWADDRLIRQARARPHRFVALLPAAGVLLLYQMCQNPLSLLLGFVLCLWLAVGFGRLAKRPSAFARWCLFTVLCVSLYHLAGAVSLIFAFLAGLAELRARCRWPQALAVLVTG